MERIHPPGRRLPATSKPNRWLSRHSRRRRSPAAPPSALLCRPHDSQVKLPGTVAMIAAGTANPTVVEECRLMLSSMGIYCYKLAESGVMGMHR